MTEEKFRLSIVILFSIFTASFILLGIRFTENIRYAQYDYRKNHIVFGNTMRNEAPAAFDKRTGEVIEIKK